MKLLFFLFLLFAMQGSASAQGASSIHLPKGFRISVYAEGIKGVRFMALSPRGDLLVSRPSRGEILLLSDRNRDGRADTPKVFASGLDRPHGLTWYRGNLLVAETGAVLRLEDRNQDGVSDARQTLARNLPAGGGHWTRTLGLGPDGWLYVSVGSSCNACLERDSRRATILRMRPDGSKQEIYARGLRNSVGFAWHPQTRELWATDNGRDFLGDNLPPDELNRIVYGGDYGWPYCYGNRVPDPEFGTLARCKNTLPPVTTFPAHSAPLGITFYTGSQFPREFRHDAFVAQHGSWNRSKKIGYKVVRVRFRNGRPASVEDFATGWLQGQSPWGRPVDVLTALDGALFISDDAGGRIYRVTYFKP